MKIYYNSKIAKMLTFVEGFSTIMLFGAVFTEKSALPEKLKLHEKVHVEQYNECSIVGAVIALMFIPFIGWSMWLISLLFIPLSFFYMIYGMEVLISYIVNFSGRKKSISDRAYDYCSLEQEAYEWQDEYLKPHKEQKWRKPFGWLKYYGKI